jgi:hypothetical protein
MYLGTVVENRGTAGLRYFVPLLCLSSFCSQISFRLPLNPPYWKYVYNVIIL